MKEDWKAEALLRQQEAAACRSLLLEAQNHILDILDDRELEVDCEHAYQCFGKRNNAYYGEGALPQWYGCSCSNEQDEQLMHTVNKIDMLLGEK